MFINIQSISNKNPESSSEALNNEFLEFWNTVKDFFSLIIIKPEVLARNNNDAIKVLSFLTEKHINVLKLFVREITPELLKVIYHDHEGTDLFSQILIPSLVSKEAVFLLVYSSEYEVCTDALKEIVGATDPAEAGQGTLRKIFGKTKDSNVVHVTNHSNRLIEESEAIFGMSIQEILTLSHVWKALEDEEEEEDLRDDIKD